MAGKSRHLAKLPWISIGSDPNLTLEDSALFKKAEIVDGNERKQQIELFLGFNKTFPFYIPISHHRLNFKDMVKDSKNGNYWRRAIHYLINNKSVESFLWNFFQESVDGTTFKQDSINVMCGNAWQSFVTLLHAFSPEEVPAQDQEAADFLLEPWVLVQLPFQPALFHQWLVAFHVEITRISMELSELCYLPLCYNKQADADLERIFDLVKSARIFVSTGFCFLQNCIDSNNNEASSIFPDINFAIYMLELIFEHNLMQVIKSYKKILWADPKVRPNKTDFSLCNYLNNIYSLEFWRDSTQERNLFCNPGKKFSLNEEHHNVERFQFDDLLESLQAYCNNEIMLSDNLRNFLKKDITFIKVLFELRKIEKISSLLRIREEEQGIIGIMMIISTYERMNDAANRAKRRLCEVTCVHPRKLLRENYNNLPDEKIARDFFAKNLLQRNGEENSSDRLKLIIKEISKRFSVQQEKLISKENLETKIVGIVLHLIKTSYKNTLRESCGNLMYRNLGMNDWQFQQYILPCFAASAQEALSTGEFSINGINMYLVIVFDLVSRFENMQDDASIENFEDKFCTTYVKKQFSSPNMLNALFREAIHNFKFTIKQIGSSFGSLYENSLLFEDLLKVLNIETRAQHQISTLKSRHFDALAYQFFHNLNSAFMEKWKQNRFGNCNAVLCELFIDLIKTICHVGFYPDKFIDDIICPEMTPECNLLLVLVRFCLRKASDADITSTHRLKKLKNLNTTSSDTSDSLLGYAKEEIIHLLPSQTLSLAFYLALKMVPSEKMSRLLPETVRDSLDLDQSFMSSAFNSYLKGGQMWVLRLLLISIHGDKLNKVQHEFARETAPVLYYVAINQLHKEGKKFILRDRSDSWCFPIEYCKNCGFLDCVTCAP